MSEKKLIELHLHLDGSLRPETVWELSKEQGIAIPASSPEDVKFKMEVPEDCKTLEEYLERFARDGEISANPCGADPLLYERGYEPGAQHADCGDGEKIPGQRGLRRGYRRG